MAKNRRIEIGVANAAANADSMAQSVLISRGHYAKTMAEGAAHKPVYDYQIYDNEARSRGGQVLWVDREEYEKLVELYR